MDRATVIISGLAVVIFAGIIGAATVNNKNFKPREQCVQHSVSLSMHIHPVVQIVVEGQPVAIPTDIGIDPTCMKAVHTHDETGTLHIEYPTANDFKLGDFFANWGQSFSSTQVMDKTVDDTHTLTMTVDGQPSTEFENLVLKDKQTILINYDKKQ